MPEYVHAPIPVDPEDLTEQAHNTLRQGFPEWEPSEGNLDTWLIEAAANMAAGIGETATDVGLAIFRYFGVEVLNLQPFPSAAATGLTTWAAIDNAGHTIPAGTVVAFSTGDTLIEFETIADAVIAPDTTTVPDVAVTALEPSAAGNDLSGDGTLIDSLEFIDTVVMQNLTGGGSDEETDDAYTTRLATELGLLTPRPILPVDFAILAKRISGVARATAISGYNPVDDSVDNERMVAVALVNEAGLPVPNPVKVEVTAYLDSLREVNFIVNVIDPVYTTIDVTFTAVTWPNWTPATVKGAAEAAVSEYLSPTSWGIIDYIETDEWVNETTVRYHEVAQAINSVEGLHYITNLTIEGGIVDITMTGVVPLPQPGTITGTVTAP